ncbi:hypothetical protein PSY31_24005, partial [Shigella flexneri]|nr:hypothetical protein [Shigella flexneri]
ATAEKQEYESDVLFVSNVNESDMLSVLNVYDNYESEVLYVSNDLAEVLTVSDDKPSSEWVLDSGCTYRMSPNISWFD